MSETKNNQEAAPLAAVTDKNKFVCKPGPVYLHNGKKYDLRVINDATAEALANDPKCKFIAFKDESKRPAGQEGVFAKSEKNDESPAQAPAKPATPAPGK